MKRATKDTDTKYEHISISIHALVKRATGANIVTRGFKAISIHALVKRATSKQQKQKQKQTFQSTPS